MQTIFSLLSIAYYKLLGRTTLLFHEQICLNAWRDMLSIPNRETLDSQLADIDFIQRQSGGAKVCFYRCADWKGLCTDGIDLFSNHGLYVLAANVFLSSPNAKGMPLRASMIVSKGRFIAIDFPKRPLRYMKLHNIDVKKLRVVDATEMSLI